MRINILAFVVTLPVAVLTWHSASAEISSSGVLLDRIVAVVNEGVILQSELDEEYTLIVEQLSEQQVRLPSPDVLREQVLERLVLKRLQLQRSERLGVVIPDEMLNQALASVARRNGLSLGQFPAALAAQGVDYSRYREQMREEMAMEQLRQRDLVSQVRIPASEVDAFLAKHGSKSDNAEYRLSHLLIAIPPAASTEQIEAARAEIEQIHDRLKSGADFGQLAVAYSDGQQALQGGDLGWRKRAELPSLFTELVDQLQPGEISDPIQNAGGFHLVRLTEQRGAEPVMVTQTRARHILLLPTELLGDAELEQKLLQFKRRIEAGEEFSEIARLNSEDPNSATRGGDLGWTSPGMTVPIFEETVNALEPGEISEPFKSPFGWHIAQLVETREYDTSQDLERNKAVAAIRGRKVEEQMQVWLRQLRDEAYVEYRM